ncbi:MAG: hypothetical protein AAGU26_10375 [bacterium]
MVKIRDLLVTQVYIFKSEELPDASIESITSINNIKEHYQFQTIVPPNNKIVIYNNGIYTFQDRIYVIKSLTIEARRIIFTISGISEIADSFFSDLLALLIPFDNYNSSKRYLPLIKTEETTTIVELSHSFSQLINNSSIAAFVKQLPELIDSKGCTLQVMPIGMRIKISYLNIPENYSSNSIRLSEKELTIEHRINTPESDNTFFIKSPNASSAHLHLLDVLDAMVP